MTAGWSCGDCGSRNLVYDMGDCAACGKSLNGERYPASRSEGMFHRRCWNARVADANRSSTSSAGVVERDKP